MYLNRLHNYASIIDLTAIMVLPMRIYMKRYLNQYLDLNGRIMIVGQLTQARRYRGNVSDKKIERADDQYG